MCDPMSLIGGAISIAASAMQAQQQAAYQNAVNEQNRKAYEISKNAREAELARQAQMEADAAVNWNETAANLTRENSDQTRDDAAQEFVQKLEDTPGAVQEGQLLSGQQYANDTIKGEIAKAANTAAADARKRIEAMAKLSAYGTTDAARSFQIGDNADFLTTLSGLRRGSLGVSQQEQNIAPAQVYQGNGGFADILSGVGGVVSSHGGRTVSSGSPAASAAVAAGRAGLY